MRRRFVPVLAWGFLLTAFDAHAEAASAETSASESDATATEPAGAEDKPASTAGEASATEGSADSSDSPPLTTTDTAPSAEAEPASDVAAPSEDARTSAAEGTAAAASGEVVVTTEKTSPASETKKGPPALAPRPGPKEPEGPKAPIKQLLTLQLVTETYWYQDDGFGLFSESSALTLGGLSGAIDFLSPLPGLHLSAEAALLGGSRSDGELFGSQTEADLQVTALSPALIVRQEVLKPLSLRARLSGAATKASVEFSLPGGASNDHEEWLFSGAVGAGFELYIPPWRTRSQQAYFNSLSFGLIAEGGFTVAQSLGVEVPDRAASEDGEPVVEQQGADLGTIDRTAPYLRVGLFLRL